jgi:hypothetical protein
LEFPLVDFVEEVEEQLRAERYATIARLYLPWFVALLLAVVIGWLGVWGYDNWRNRNIGVASLAYDKALSALASGDQAGAYDSLGAIAKDGPSAYRALALMQQANIRLTAGKGDIAAGLFDAAAKAAPNAILRDLASLRAAQAVMDIAPYPQVAARLTPLIGDKRPFALQAREMLAMAKLQAGMTQEARGDFNALSLTLGVTPGMRARAQSAIALIDSGQGALVGQIVKLAASLPPSARPIIPGLSDAPGPGPAATPDQDGPPREPPVQTPAGTPQ